MEALARSSPGVGATASTRSWRRQAEIVRLGEALKEMGVRLMLVEGKGVGTEWPGPTPRGRGHQDGSARAHRRRGRGGWDLRRACRLLELKERRAFRWRHRRDRVQLADRTGGGHAVHGLLPPKLTRSWPCSRSGARSTGRIASLLIVAPTGRVWVSPSSVRRVLAAQGLHLRRPHRTGTSKKRPFPDGRTTRNSHLDLRRDRVRWLPWRVGAWRSWTWSHASG